MTLMEQFSKARLVSMPLIGIRTADPAYTIANLATTVTDDVPVFIWDSVRGIMGHNQPAKAALEIIFRDVDPVEFLNPTNMLVFAAKLPGEDDRKGTKGSILFIVFGHVQLADEKVVQATWNLRDLYKQNRRTAVFLGPDIRVPAELVQDMTVFDEPLPDSAQLAAVVIGICEDASRPRPKDAVLMQCVDALRGLSPFSAETVTAMALLENGSIDTEAMWDRKIQQVESTGTLKVHRGDEQPGDVKGMENTIGFLEGIMEGDDPPAEILVLDEIEKMIAGMGNDQDSTTKEMVGMLLKWCDQKIRVNGRLVDRMIGILLLGPSGTGKTMTAKAIGNKYKKLTVMADLSTMKGELMGQSQRQQAEAFKVVDAVAGDKPVLVIATCNSDRNIPPELRRRFSLATFYVDLPSDEARLDMWKSYKPQFGITEKDNPPDKDWTGAEIRNCCIIAKRRKCSLKEAAGFVSPVAIAAAEDLAALRRTAHGRYISAAKPGPYKAPDVITAAPDAFPQTARRKMN